MRKMTILSLLIGLLLLAVACGGGSEPEVAAPAVETETESEAPEMVEEAAEAPEVAEEAPPAFKKYELPMGKTDEGVFFIGNEDAPVTMIDYSNFL